MLSPAFSRVYLLLGQCQLKLDRRDEAVATLKEGYKIADQRGDKMPRDDMGRLLTELDLAFSRDQREKVYVQHLMRKRGDQLWRWLQDGAQLYVCGNADPMAKDVDRALCEIATEHGNLAPDAAKDYVQSLSADKRYHRDVY